MTLPYAAISRGFGRDYQLSSPVKSGCITVESIKIKEREENPYEINNTRDVNGLISEFLSVRQLTSILIEAVGRVPSLQLDGICIHHLQVVVVTSH
jgi:hypothetical protein